MILPPFVCSCHEDKNPQQHVPLQEYSENLKAITRLLATAGVSADRVIFITPPPLHEPAWEKECILKGNIHSQCFSPRHTDHFYSTGLQRSWMLHVYYPGCALNRHNSVAGQYAQACVQTAGECGTDVLDLWTLMQKDGQVGSTHHGHCCMLFLLL